MSDIVSAKCSGCGHVIRVPLALGGKKAKCPQCAQVIVIPTQPDPAGEFISDDQLPEVARDEDILQGLPVEEEDEVMEGEPVEESPAGGRLRSMTPRRGTPTAGTRVGRTRGGSGAHSKVPAQGGYAPPRKSSSAVPVIIGVIVAAVVIVAVAVAALSGGGGKKGKEPDKAPAPAPPPTTEADNALQLRCLEFISVFNKGDLIQIMKFYTYGPGEEQKVKGSVSSLLEQGTRYDDVGFKSTSAAAGTVTFTHAKGERTLTWKQVEGVWLIAGP